MNNSHFTSSNQGLWGPVSSTLDWCEANYQFSHLIAEMANSLSNVVTIAFALVGVYHAWNQSLPKRYIWGYFGVAIVGAGSFAFHATLLYSAQLADELPMILVATWNAFTLYDTSAPSSHPPSIRSYLLLASYVIFNTIFTITYAINRDPIFHQRVFTALLFLAAFRTEYLIRYSTPGALLPKRTVKQLRTIFYLGVFAFVTGVAIWNVDNELCGFLTEKKRLIGWPAAFLLEGHAWWHFFTAIGTYLLLTGSSYL